MAGYIPRWFTCLRTFGDKKITHTSTNWS